MARKRMIDPSIWTDEGMDELTPRQQLLYIGLFSNADDDGRLKGSAAAIRLMLPTIYRSAESQVIDADLSAVLRVMRQLSRYSVEGRTYLAFKNYRQWQRIDKPTPSALPAPPEESESVPVEVAEESTNDPRVVPPKRIEVKRSKEKGDEENMAPDKPARAREPDMLFEAVVQVCYERPHTDITDSERRRVNQALPELRKVRASPADIFERAATYRSRSPNFPLTPQTLTKSWTDLGNPRPIHAVKRNGGLTPDQIRNGPTRENVIDVQGSVR